MYIYIYTYGYIYIYVYIYIYLYLYLYIYIYWTRKRGYLRRTLRVLDLHRHISEAGGWNAYADRIFWGSFVVVFGVDFCSFLIILGGLGGHFCILRAPVLWWKLGEWACSIMKVRRVDVYTLWERHLGPSGADLGTTWRQLVFSSLRNAFFRRPTWDKIDASWAKLVPTWFNLDSNLLK